MKFIYVEASYKGKAEIPLELIKKLPKTVALFSSIQYVKSLDGTRKQLEKAGKKALLLKTRHTKHAGQLLGCNIDPFREKFDAALYIGDGMFHPKALLMRNERPVFSYDPKTKEHRELSVKDVEDMKSRHKAGLVRFLSSTHIGVIVSTKPGQQYLKKALELKKKWPEKKFYYLVSNDINWQGLEDFPFIEMFINAACARIGFDDTNKISKAVLNLEDALDAAK